jgi:dUTP pyrophosphatase
MIPRFVDYELGEGARRPFKKHEGDAGWDLFVSRPCDIPPGETVDVHTDIRIDMPVNIYARITGRSSSLRKLGLLVNEGIIDNGYTGELFVCVHNMTDDTFHVEKGMRLAQVIFHQIEDIRWCEVDHIGKSSDGRGDSGFGSTGR